jgi:hypothetical protein
MDYLKFINFSAISEELTGSKTRIKQNRIPGQYEPMIEELDQLLRYWIERTKIDPYKRKGKPRGKPQFKR